MSEALLSPSRFVAIDGLAGPAWIQDGGRRGHLHEGVPPGGAWVPELLAAANGAVGNRWDAPAIELFVPGVLTAVGGPLTLGISGRGAVQLAEGEALRLGPPQPERLAYVAVRGGFVVPRVLGGTGLLRVASLGGWEGRPLRRGDRLPVAAAAEPFFAPPHQVAALDPRAAIRVIPGPDEGAFASGALDAFCAASWRIDPASDRTGLRLLGPALERRGADAGISLPMVEGAIEVPAGGAPIVLGPDHPTTGGYPVIATVIRADRGALAARRPGAEVRFEVVEADVARAAWAAHRARWEMLDG
ncbi:biotin-dependent carboxyltransferase family protein [Vulgatibacter sp.]|uniref:5-oxoprolinase subunit C family protein n=1 Tax=Vulgatibacter sp. TaxID=1971226 RepID=UPI003568F45C